jgi:hypothetical protein
MFSAPFFRPVVLCVALGSASIALFAPQSMADTRARPNFKAATQAVLKTTIKGLQVVSPTP